MSKPGAPPQDHEEEKPPALKARFTFWASSMHDWAMPQSLSKVILDVIFSTKKREPWLDSNLYSAFGAKDAPRQCRVPYRAAQKMHTIQQELPSLVRPQR